MDERPVAIAVAPNGARLLKRDHPNLPLTPAELARTAAECLEAGAAMIHLHVRDAEGRHVLDEALYREATAAVRREVGPRLIVQATTEAVGRYRPAEQAALVRALRPEAVSVALRELAADEAEAARFYAWCHDEGVAVQHILYDAADVARLVELRRRAIVPGERVSVLFVLGRYAADQQSHPRDLAPFLAAADPDWSWMLCAFGRLEHDCALAAALAGGHARIGFENNRLLRDGTTAPSNAALVAQFARTLRALGRLPASAEDLRGSWAGSR